MSSAAAAAGTTTNTPGHGRLLTVSLAALGVVYGDIGTSPLYAMRESLHGAHGVPPTPATVLGLLSLFVWALIIVVSIKYLVFVMRADNCGEGGIIALTALVTPTSATARRRRRVLVLVGLFGASLLYGDSMITPAISVLSAVEGLEMATPIFRPYVVPFTIAILVGLFAVWSHGRQGYDGTTQGTKNFQGDVTDLFRLHPANTFLIKMSYWLNR